jgi:hypothetical protein
VIRTGLLFAVLAVTIAAHLVVVAAEEVLDLLDVEEA